MPDDRFALALHHPDGTREWWTGGVRLAGGEFVPEFGARDAAWRFATPEEATETLDGFRQAFQPGPQLARLAVANLAEEPAGSGAKVTTTTVKDSLGRVYKLLTAGP